MCTVKKNIKTNVIPISWKRKEISQKSLRIWNPREAINLWLNFGENPRKLIFSRNERERPLFLLFPFFDSCFEYFKTSMIKLIWLITISAGVMGERGGESPLLGYQQMCVCVCGMVINRGSAAGGLATGRRWLPDRVCTVQDRLS